MHRFFWPNAIFRRVRVQNVGEGNPGFRKRVGSPACGGGVEEGEPARSAKIFFFAALEGDFIINSFSWTPFIFAFTD